MARAIYEVIVKDPDAGTLWEVIPKSYSFIDRLNKEPTADFSFSFEELKLGATANDTTVANMFTAALREIYVNRTKNGTTTKIFYGVITDFVVTPGGKGERTVSIKAMGFFGLFKKRLVGIGTETVYSATDAGDIAWDLIDDSQNSDTPYSDWGITQGATPATKNRDRTYFFDNVYESIVKLSSDNLADGFDFDIDNSKQFNVYYPTKGQARPTVVFDERTMSGWRFVKSLYSDMANIVYAIGEGFNESINYETRTASTALRTPFGTLEEKLEARNVTEATTLQDKGDKRLDDASAPNEEVQGVQHYDDESAVSFDDYNVGDTVIVNLPDFEIDNESFRVRERRFVMQSSESIGLCTLVLE
jgi:hypothetical protein